MAKKLAGLLLKRRLAACVSIQSNFVSYYHWKGKIERAREYFLLIKAPAKNFSKIDALIAKNHPYQTPEVLAVSVIRGSGKYLAWLQTSASAAT